MKETSVATHPDQDREFELVLGNKQLFSLLFLVFVLLGVFFAMGYVMGRNSGPSDVARQGSASDQAEAGTSSARPSAASGSSERDMPPTIPASEAATSRAIQTATQRSASPSSETEVSPAREEHTTAASRFIDPRPGQVFLQVSAVARPEAELLVEVLSRKGFRAAMAPGPTDKVIRVLVGPIPNDGEVTKTRSDLEGAGFKTIVRRY